MSTDFRPLTPIRMADLFDGRLKDVGVHEHHSKEAMADEKCLTDGRNFLWVYGDEKGLVSTFARYRPNGAPQHILRAISDAFDVDIVSEYEPQFWGFETQEEWDAWEHARATKAEEDFYKEVVKFVRGEAHDIKPGTIGMIQAEIAKRLIAESPNLLAEDKRPDLIKAVNLVYKRDHAVFVKLTDEEVSVVRMAATTRTIYRKRNLHAMEAWYHPSILCRACTERLRFRSARRHTENPIHGVTENPINTRLDYLCGMLPCS
jgi:hypothetical protein